MNVTDSNISSITDDKFSYIFGLNSSLNKNFSLKFKWYVKDNLMKKVFDVYDEEEASQIFYYDKDLLNKWYFEFEYKF